MTYFWLIMNSRFFRILLLIFCFTAVSLICDAQGTWIPIAKPSPDFNNGVMLLLSDGSVLAKSCKGGIDTLGNRWDRLVPDTNGSYVNGTWSRIDTTHYTRLYCSSQMLKDGRVYLAGGEYGTGSAKAETYDPLTGKWTVAGPLPTGFHIYDGNSEMLPDGRVLQAIVSGGSKGNVIFDPVTNTYSPGPTCIGNHDESAWLKLPDNSILFVDINTRLSERYIPAQNTWVRDDTVPVMLYDPYGYEAGASFMLPDGRAFFIGSPGTTAFYTPSGNDSPGVWSAGPSIPGGFGAPDAPAAMMANGKLLCAFSRQAYAAQHFPSPTVFYEFDYTNNTFTSLTTPAGKDTLNNTSYACNFLDLPDGSVMYTLMATDKYYVYLPNGKPLAAGKPHVDTIIKIDCDEYIATGNGFNGICEGAAYGDDWQMPTNFPIVRLVKHDSLYGDYIYYARSYNWNSRGVMRGALRDTTWFTLPDGLPDGSYNLEVVANGNPSEGYLFTTCNTVIVSQTTPNRNKVLVYPNPATSRASIVFSVAEAGMLRMRIVDVLGRMCGEETIEAVAGENTHVIHLEKFGKGIYSVILQHERDLIVAKMVVE
jgi:Secretion system C-terminal sorting domain/Galactose oxidase, central domain